MNFKAFLDSLAAQTPPRELSAPLRALWYDFTNDWHQAHETIQNDEDQASASVHAYLHRKEGDLWNARYWYKIAGKRPVSGPLEQEREQLVKRLLEEADSAPFRRDSPEGARVP